MRVLIPETGGMSDWKPVRQMFKDEGWDIYGADTIKFGLGMPDLICFTGGADVSPELYGEVNTMSFCDWDRDVTEMKLYTSGLSLGIPMVGICRGGQFLNVMNGGKMIQHLGETISGDVEALLYGGLGEPVEYEVRVDHHQGIVPVEGTEEFLVYKHDVFVTYGCFYTKTRCLCFQPHPEWGHEPTRGLFFDLIEEYVI